MMGREQCTDGDRLIDPREATIQKTRVEPYGVRFLGLDADPIHRHHRFNRVTPRRCFGGQHHRVGAIQNRVGHV